jgi:hypothetical protein
MANLKTINLAVSAHGYGAEAAFDYRAQQTGYTVIKPRTGREFLEILQYYSKQGAIENVKIFSHSYPRGIIMTNWSGFYKSPGPEDTPRAAYVKDMALTVERGEIVFSSEVKFMLFGCNITNASFTQDLSLSIKGVVIGAEGGVYPEIINGRETGVFISTHRWIKYCNGTVAVSNLGKRIRAW